MTRALSANEKRAIELAQKEQEFWEKRGSINEMVGEFQDLVGLIEHLGLHEALEGIFGQMDGSPDQQQARWDLRVWCDHHICELDDTPEKSEEEKRREEEDARKAFDEQFPLRECAYCPRGYGIEERSAGYDRWFVPYLIRRVDSGANKVYKSYICWNKDYSTLPYLTLISVEGNIASRNRRTVVNFLIGFDWHMPPMPEGQIWRD